MSTDSMPAAGDPRLLLADLRALAHRVRLDRRMTWVALLILAAVTLVAIPFDWLGTRFECTPAHGCGFERRGMVLYWPVAGLLAYAAIAVCYLRAARARGLGGRVLPYAVTGAVTTFVTPAAWLAITLYLANNPEPTQPLPYWYLVVDRLVLPWGMIGVTLLVLAWLERNVPLLVFTLGYLALVLVLPTNTGFGLAGWGLQARFALPQALIGVVLLLGALGFRAAHRRKA